MTQPPWTTGSLPPAYAVDPQFAAPPVFEAQSPSSPPSPSAGCRGPGRPPAGYGAIADLDPEWQEGDRGAKMDEGAARRRNILIGVGALLIELLCILPVWNAVVLLRDPNYAFWHGAYLPAWMLVICAGVVALYLVTMLRYFRAAGPQAEVEQTVMMTAATFVTLLGLALMLVSMPLSRQAQDTYAALSGPCREGPRRQALFEYSQVLQNIRATAGCLAKYSVEECPGYQEALPYTGFLKAMETRLHCRGYCWAAEASAAAAAPRTLFSSGQLEVSCERAAADSIVAVAGGVAGTTFWQGADMIALGAAVGLLGLASVCLGRDSPKRQ